MLHAESAKTYNVQFLLIPVIFTNSFEDVCPPELRKIVCSDLTWMYVDSKAEVPTVHPTQRPQLHQFVGEIAARISAITATKQQKYRDRQDALFKRFLFEETKSAWDRPENYPYLHSLFVKTWTFKRVRRREISFVVGRKGAGKSTITHVLPLLSQPVPAFVLRIDFEQLPLEMCFNILRERPGPASDLRNAFSPILSYELLWDAFIHLFLAWQARSELPGNSAPRKNLFKQLLGDLRRASDDDNVDAVATRVLFVHVFERLMAFTDSIVRQKDPAFLARAVGEFTPARFRTFVLGNGWSALQKLLKRLKTTGSRVLVTVDGFDVRTDYFARGADATEREAAVRFEGELLLGLFQVVLKSRP